MTDLSVESVRRLLAAQYQAVHKTDEQLLSLQDTKRDYGCVMESLQQLPKRVSHSAMLPFSKKAFVLGDLVRTNEVHLFLGCDYWVHVSTTQAYDLLKQRVIKLGEQIEKLQSQRDLLQDRMQFTSELVHSQPKEIQEPYNEAEEAEWRNRHWQRMREDSAKRGAAAKGAACADDEDDQQDKALLQLLDQLELEENKEELGKSGKKVHFVDEVVQQPPDLGIVRIEDCSSDDSDDDVEDDHLAKSGTRAQRIHFLDAAVKKAAVAPSAASSASATTEPSSSSSAFQLSVAQQVVERAATTDARTDQKGVEIRPMSRFKAMRQARP